MITRLRDFFNSRAGKRSLNRMGTIRLRSAAEFREELRLERLRADRRQISFGLLRLILNGSSRRASEARRFVRLMAENLRATDEKGLTGRYVMSILLVDTTTEGIQVVVNRLEALALRNGFDARVEMKTYHPHVPGPMPPGFEDGAGASNRRGSDRRQDDESNDDSGSGFGRPFVGDSSIQNLETDDSGVLAGTKSGSQESQGDQCRVLADGRRLRVEEADDFGMSYGRNSVFREFSKRLIDITGASLGLIAAAPVLGAAMLAIRATSDGPAIFTQAREGRSGQVFIIYKLRTMYRDAEARQAALRSLSERDGPTFKMRNDPRVTRIGHFLRLTCLDELPQLLNVIKGDMSLVGPRPLPVAESRACQAWHRRRLDVRPGLTCHWQIDKERAETFDDWMRLDLAYVDRGGMIADLWLILKTLRVPMGGRGGD